MARYDYRCTACGEVFEVEHAMTERPEVSCPKCGAKAEGLSPQAASPRRKRLLQHRSARRELLDGSDLRLERQQLIYRLQRFCRLVAFLRELPAQKRVGAPTQFDLLPALAHCLWASAFFCKSKRVQGARERARCPLHAKIAHVHPAWPACMATPGRPHGNAGLHARQRRVACARPAKAVSTFGHFSGILESITQMAERKHQVDCLPFRTFALDQRTPQSSAQKLKTCSACFSKEAFGALSKAI